MAFASGMTAISSTLLNLAGQGDETVAVKTLYGGSTTLFSSLLPEYGITTRFVEDEMDLNCYEKLITDKTRAIYVECLGNPLMNILDLKAITDLAHTHGIPVVIDNTFATPSLLRPFDFGVDIVCYFRDKVSFRSRNCDCRHHSGEGGFQLAERPVPTV